MKTLLRTLLALTLAAAPLVASGQTADRETKQGVPRAGHGTASTGGAADLTVAPPIKNPAPGPHATPPVPRNHTRKPGNPKPPEPPAPETKK